MSNQKEIKDPQAAVANFIRTFSASLDPRLWVELIREEHNELLDALVAFDTPEPNRTKDASANLKAEVLKELVDLSIVAIGCGLVWKSDASLVSKTEREDIALLSTDVAQIISYVTEKFSFSDNTLMEAFVRVHASNMSKLGNDGKPVLRADGKIMKGPNYKPPYLLDLV